MSAALAQTVNLDGSADAGTSGEIAGLTLTGTGRVRQVVIILPPGSDGLLHLTPYLLTQSGDRTSLVRFSAGAPHYVAGDNQVRPFDCDVPYATGDTLTVLYDNLGTLTHEWKCSATVTPGQGG